MSKLDELKKKLREIFQLDRNDLDFGIYKILNEKNAEVTDFLDNKLIPQVRECFTNLANSDKSNIQKELDEAINQAKSLGIDPDTSPKVKELKAQLLDSVDLSLLENDVYSHLISFFSRYYNNGDFMSLRRYKKDVYAIPYEGEEVKLHWANSDQYYIKTSENFKDYSFTIGDEDNKKSIHFKLVEAETEKDNNKADKERRFMLVEEEPVYIEDAELFIKFEYKVDENKTKQEAINKSTIERLLPELNKDDYSEFKGLLELFPTEKNKTRTILEKHLADYTAKNSFDYFIHKDLGGFLNRELDFYIKNEVLNLDDLDEKNIQKNLGKAKAIKEIAKKLITFLAQLENFQKKLWLKKKFVVETNYCITLDKINETFYIEIINNKAQIEEWENLFSISDIKTDLTKLGGDVLNGNDESKKLEFLKQNPYLMIDTKFFSKEFKYKLLSTIENLDEQTNGLLINADNFHALNLLQEKYKEKIKCIYIDPPYNTGNDGFIYKDALQHSSWLSMLESRLHYSKTILENNGAAFISIDDNEIDNLRKLGEQLFGKLNLETLIWNKEANGSSGTLKQISTVRRIHEYVICFYKSYANTQFRKIREALVGKENEFQTANLAVNLENEKRDHINYFTITNPSGDKFTRHWKWSREEISQLIEENLIYWGSDGHKQPRLIIPTDERRTTFLSSILNYGGTTVGRKDLESVLGKDIVFSYPKPVILIQKLGETALTKSSIILDYFAGSGTTGHATIELNRDDNGNRKYILVEMGKYFNTVTKPRIQKVVYSREWKDGKPVNRDGVSQIVKYMSLESYEDACNNLRQKEMQISLSAELEEQYKLNYMFDYEYSDSLLNIEMFENPFDYKMKITESNETNERNIDLIETFNYLIGLNVISIYQKDGFILVEGKNRIDENILVIWRNTKEKSNADLDEFLKKRKISTQDFEFKKIYVNGDNNLQNLQTEDENFKVTLIEEEFKKRMFSIQDV